MIMPYLHFNGKCEEAFLWYVQLFGGSVTHMVKYGDSPHYPAGKEQKDWVMHAQVMLTQAGGISGADYPGASTQCSGIHLHAHLPTAQKAREIFDGFAVEGTVQSPLMPNPAPDDSSLSGAVTDKYGFTWILSAPKDGDL